VGPVKICSRIGKWRLEASSAFRDAGVGAVGLSSCEAVGVSRGDFFAGGGSHEFTMELKVVRAKCVEIEIGGDVYVECFLRNGRVESIAMYLGGGEWFARYQSCKHPDDCELAISKYLAIGLARGGASRIYDDVAAVCELGCNRALYVFKSGHVVLVNKAWDGWQDYIGTIGTRLEDLMEHVRDRYDRDVYRQVEEALKRSLSTLS